MINSFINLSKSQKKIKLFLYVSTLGLIANSLIVDLPFAVPLTLGNVAFLFISVKLGFLWGILSLIITLLPSENMWLWSISAAQLIAFMFIFKRKRRSVLVTFMLYFLLTALLCWQLLPDAINSSPLYILLHSVLTTAIFAWCYRATVVFSKITVNRHQMRQQPLQKQLSNRFGLYSLIPATFLISVLLNGGSSLNLVDTISHYQQSIDQLKLNVELRLNDYASRAKTLSYLPPHDIDESTLRSIVDSSPEFISALISDSEGTIKRFFKEDVDSTVVFNSSIKDRDYFINVKNTKTTYISDTFKGRTLGNDQLFVVSSPLGQEDAFDGIIQIAIELDALLGVLPEIQDENIHTVLIDSVGKKIWGHNVHGEVGEFWNKPEAVLPMHKRFLTDSIYNPLNPVIVSKDANHFILSQDVSGTGWVLEYFVDTQQSIISFYAFVLIALGLIALILEASMYLSGKFVGGYTSALVQLADFTQKWDETTSMHNKPIFRHSAKEINTLTESFMALTDKVIHSRTALIESINQTKQLNLELEHRVELRTRELENEKDKAQKLALVKTRFLANMSHEIRTPITIIKGFTEELIDDTEGNIRSNLVKISKNTEHLYNLVNDILDVAKIDEGKMSVCLDWFSLSAILDDCYSNLQQLAKPKDIRVSYENNTPPNLNVWVDSFRFKQILFNLVSNAVKFTADGEIKLSVEYLGDSLQIRLQDQGIGIAEDKIPMLFEAFTQTDSSIGRDFGGTGLGLYITKQFCDAMGLNLQLISKLNVGTTFTISIPSQLISFESNSYEQAKQDELSLVKLTKDTRILIVDDVKDIRDLLTSFFKKSRTTVNQAADGFEALEMVRSSNYDLIIIDQQMPKMDGTTTARKIREYGFTGCLIQLSADVFLDEEEQTTFDYKLKKPIDRAQLISILNTVLNKPHTQTVNTDPSDDNDLSAKYREHLLEQVSLLEAVFSRKEYEKLMRELHKIKGTSACFGLDQVSKSAHQTEQQLKNGYHGDDLLHDLFLKIKVYCKA